jgi:hypothetical protein
LVARNVAVGASPLALSAIGVEGIVYGHAVDTAPAGLNVPAATTRILQASDGRLVETIRGTLATYDGDWMLLLRNEAARAAAIFSTLEGSDNVNWYYFAERSRILAYSLRYEVVLGFGLVGLWLARRRVRGDDRIVLYYLGVSLAALQFVPVIGRYRLVPATLLLIYAAVTVVAIGRALSAHDWRAAAGPALASACLTFVSARLLLVPGVREWCRPSEYLIAAQTAVARQNADGLYDALDECLECLVTHADRAVLPPGFQALARDFATVASQMGRTADATAVLERLSAAYPADPVLPQLLAASAFFLQPGGRRELP